MRARFSQYGLPAPRTPLGPVESIAHDRTCTGTRGPSGLRVFPFKETAQNARIVSIGIQAEAEMNTDRSREARHPIAYSPYGYSPALATNGSSLGFNGEHFQPATASYPLGSGYRQYNPLLMRFTSADSLSPFAAGGINAYAYCLGDPVNRMDPTGHFSISGIYQGLRNMVAVIQRHVMAWVQPGHAKLALGAQPVKLTQSGTASSGAKSLGSPSKQLVSAGPSKQELRELYRMDPPRHRMEAAPVTVVERAVPSGIRPVDAPNHVGNETNIWHGRDLLMPTRGRSILNSYDYSPLHIPSLDSLHMRRPPPANGQRYAYAIRQ